MELQQLETGHPQQLHSIRNRSAVERHHSKRHLLGDLRRRSYGQRSSVGHQSQTTREQTTCYEDVHLLAGDLRSWHDVDEFVDFGVWVQSRTLHLWQILLQVEQPVEVPDGRNFSHIAGGNWC